MQHNTIHCGDSLEWLKTLPDECVQCCVTSPPYFGLRSYLGKDDPHKHLELGSEKTPELYVKKMTEVFREARRVLRKDGTLWLNMGDSYAGSNQGTGTRNPTAKQASNKGTNYIATRAHKSLLANVHGLKPKDLVGVPWRLAFALQADGWWLRSDIIWHKLNPMPESVRDRPTKAHEYIFLMSKSAKYYYDTEAIREEGSRYEWNTQKFKCGDITKHHRSTQGKEEADPSAGRNKRTVWAVATQPFKEAHYATFPPKLIEPCILAGCPKGGIVLDPFMGSGTTAMVAQGLGRNFLGCELNADNVRMAKRRIFGPLYSEVI